MRTDHSMPADLWRSALGLLQYANTAAEENGRAAKDSIETCDRCNNRVYFPFDMHAEQYAKEAAGWGRRAIVLRLLMESFMRNEVLRHDDE